MELLKLFKIIIATNAIREVIKTSLKAPLKIASALLFCFGSIIANSYLPVEIDAIIFAILKYMAIKPKSSGV